MTKCTHCDATVLSTSQPAAASGWDDPADVWKAYCAETPTKRRSPQGALAFGFHAALVATPALITSDPAPDPCGDLSISELIEWLDNPQWTNGSLDSEATNHMSSAAMLIEKLMDVPALAAAPGEASWRGPATPAVGGEPVAWRYQRKEGWGNIWRYYTEMSFALEASDDWIVQPLYAAQPVSPLRGREPTDEQIEIACAAYAKATSYYVEFHRGLSSTSSDEMRKGMRAALSTSPPEQPAVPICPDCGRAVDGPTHAAYCPRAPSI